MNEKLLRAIQESDPVIMQLFAEPFDTPLKWYWYLKRAFGVANAEPPYSVKRILDNPGRWHSAGFQALYIACWIYHPVEKGSYMIQLTPQQRANAQASAAKLTWRISSHLSSTSYSARGGEDFQFIKGYGELLVIVEGDYLFLKMEGHNAMSMAHMASWVEKIRTGAGATANQHLNDLATGNGGWGIQERGAENYSHSYKALLKALGLKGTMVSFADLVLALRAKFPSVHIPPGSDEQALRGYFRNLLNFARVSPHCSREFMLILNAAERDIVKMIADLAADELRLAPGGFGNLGMDRIYREVRVAPETLDASLERFIAGVLQPPRIRKQGVFYVGVPHR